MTTRFSLRRLYTRKGALVLVTVIIVGIVGIILSVVVARRGATEVTNSLSALQASRALSLADGCAEEAMVQLYRSSAYVGGTAQLGEGTCTITVSGTGTERTILVVATLEKWVRTVQFTAHIVPPMRVTAWRLIAE